MSDPDQPRKVRTWNRTFGNAHTLWIDPDKGLLFANGTSFGMRVLDLEPNPDDPREVGAFKPFYIHDSVHPRQRPLRVRHQRRLPRPAGRLAIPRSIREMTRFFTGGRFTHNSWLSPRQPLPVHHRRAAGRPLEGWDIADPFPPRKVAEYIAARTRSPTT